MGSEGLNEQRGRRDHGPLINELEVGIRRNAFRREGREGITEAFEHKALRLVLRLNVGRLFLEKDRRPFLLLH